MKQFQLLFLLCMFALSCTIRANNLFINNVTATTSSVTFEISWNNSWNVQNLSRDAVWVFVKYQDCGSTNKSWDHLDLSSTSGDHSISGSLLRVDAVSDGKGVFIRRLAFGGGDNPVTQVTLAFSSPFSDISQVNFDVIGIEMVFVPEGSFYASDGASNNYMGNNGTATIRHIQNEDAIPANGLSRVSSGCCNDEKLRHPAIHAGFPKGYASFYNMKYEITQGQYVHFLNSLPATQQGIRTAIPPTSAANSYAMTTATPRANSIKIITPAAGNPMTPAVYGCDFNNNNVYNEACDGADIACNWLNWGDLLAYLDWSALRPMTEIEFEKACRGPSTAGTPIANQYAWGSTVSLLARRFNSSNVSITTNPGCAGEVFNNMGPGLSAQWNGGCCGDDPSGQAGNGPFRVGFAAGTGTSREQAGATYYGIMEMTGNVREQTMKIGSVHGNIVATFNGTLGDGTLDADGNANQSTWGNANEIIWSAIRGGCWHCNAGNEGAISDRAVIGADSAGNDSRDARNGGRGVRQYAD